jgi:ATP-dependent DNA helicase RecG
MAAFLNGAGGTVVMGVTVDGTVVGVDDAAGVAQRLASHLAQTVSPKGTIDVYVDSVDGLDCVVARVAHGSELPYLYENVVFARHGTATSPATGEDVSRLIQLRQAMDPRWESVPAPGIEVTDLDGDLIRATAMAARERHYQDLGSTDGARGVLEALHLSAAGAVFNGAVVLYGASPERRFPQTRVRVGRFAGDANQSLVDSRILSGSAFALLDQIISFFRSHIGIRAEIAAESDNWVREDKPAYPWGALREATLNALQHRDYAAFDGGVSISIFADRIEFWNAGSLPSGWSVADLGRGYVSRPHNPTIAHVFYLHGLVERIGIGTSRIIAECAAAGLPDPVWEVRQGGVALTLRAAAPATPLVADLNRRQLTYLQVTAPGDILTAEQYRESFGAGLSERTTRKDLAQMEAMGLVQRVGSARSTAYRRLARPTA